MKFTATSFFFLLIFSSLAQSVSLEFSTVQTEDSTKYQLDQLKFYIGHVALYQAGELVHQSDEYFILDLIGGSSKAKIPTKKNVVYDSIAFEIGVDSVHNVAGILDGALDPSKGMYWSWQSGYINFKVEATNPTKQAFVYHLGGYMPPFACNQAIGFSTKAAEVKIALHVDAFLDEVSQTHEPRVMSPGQATLDISETLKAYFRLAQ